MIQGEIRKPEPGKMEFHVPDLGLRFAWHGSENTGKGGEYIEVIPDGEEHGIAVINTDNGTKNPRNWEDSAIDFTEENLRREAEEWLTEN
jgi:hypothetical protein